MNVYQSTFSKYFFNTVGYKLMLETKGTNKNYSFYRYRSIYTYPLPHLFGHLCISTPTLSSVISLLSSASPPLCAPFLLPFWKQTQHAARRCMGRGCEEGGVQLRPSAGFPLARRQEQHSHERSDTETPPLLSGGRHAHAVRAVVMLLRDAMMWIWSTEDRLRQASYVCPSAAPSEVTPLLEWSITEGINA